MIFSFSANAQVTRPTSFDDRKICEEEKGMWREYSDDCANECRAKFDEFAICTKTITSACQCPRNKCWNDGACIALKDYKKIFDEEQEKEREIIAKQQEERKDLARQNSEQILNKLSPIIDGRNLATKAQDAGSSVTSGINQVYQKASTSAKSSADNLGKSQALFEKNITNTASSLTKNINSEDKKENKEKSQRESSEAATPLPTIQLPN